jgi:hypothetical protein
MANRLIMGYDNGSYKFRISKPGFDALVASTANLLLSDAAASRAIYKVINGSVIVPGGGGVTNIVHPNYGQMPFLYYRASPDTADTSYNYIVYNFEVITRSDTGFGIRNNNTADQRVLYYLWIV